MYEPEHFEMDVKLVRCPGCPAMMEPGDTCCDLCWRRVPLLLRSRLRVPHLKRNYPKHLAAKLRILAWLMEHRLEET